ncbi:MAG: type II toxin-antitoxin system RelE/ParE family toxin [Rhodocyclaceae bacterium]|nr:type II toxin-antitoxin system RelE/ParE family toxin [Rhodocyclaceae bacterium]
MGRTRQVHRKQRSLRVSLASVHLTRAADGDARAAIKYYAQEAGQGVASAFREALKESLAMVAKFPKAGSTTLGTRIGRAGLRTWPLKNFPYLVIYTANEKGVTVFRILHTRRDLPTAFGE